MDPQEFLKLLWGDPIPGPIYVWMLPKKQTIWFVNLDHANRTLSRYEDCDIYTGAGLAPPDNPKTGQADKRVEQDEVAGLAGLWADIDIAHPVHDARKTYAPSQEKILDLVEDLPMEPTLLVNSGHGIQAWWLFDQPWIFANQDEHWQARTLSQWWTTRISELFGRKGWHIDAVQNLDRIMRIPGTWNNKVPSNRKKVEVVEQSGRRYPKEEFLDMMPPDFQPKVTIHHMGVTGDIIGGDQLVLDPQAEPPTMKLQVLLEEDENFRGSWKGKRSDWPQGADHSASAYDMSLASIAIRYDWTDQEVADLLVAKRRRLGEDLKLREKYYANTIAKAKLPMEREKAEERLEELISTKVDWDPEQRQAAMNDLSRMMGIRINRLVKYLGDPSSYWMSTEQGDITIGKIASLTNQNALRNAVADATGEFMEPCKADKWRMLVKVMLRACEPQDTGDTSHPTTETKAWLNAYLSENTPTTDMEEALIVKAPFILNSHIHIFLERFIQWVDHCYRENISNHAMGQRLKKCEATAEKVNMKLNDKRTSRTCWKLPLEYTDAQPNLTEEVTEDPDWEDEGDGA